MTRSVQAVACRPELVAARLLRDLAYGLGARHAQDLLGADLGQLVRHEAVKPVRLADAVRTTATTEENATIRGVLRQVLPVLLAAQEVAAA